MDSWCCSVVRKEAERCQFWPAKVNPTAVVIFSAAPGHSFVEIFKLSVPPAVAQHADDEFKKIQAEPLSGKVWGGNSYRWWADSLRQDMTADLLKAESPILLVQGERDSHAPVAIARQIRDDFQRAGHRNLTYWEFAAYASRHAGRARNSPSRPSNDANIRVDRGKAAGKSERQVTMAHGFIEYAKWHLKYEHVGPRSLGVVWLPAGFIKGHFPADGLNGFAIALVLSELQGAPGSFEGFIKALITGVSRGQCS